MGISKRWRKLVVGVIYILTCITTKSSSSPNHVPAGYLKQSNCLYYKPYYNPASWTAAREACARDGAELAIAMNSATNVILATYAKRALMWFNANDIDNEGRWVTTRGDSISFENWAQHQPNNHGNQDCGEMHEDGFWYDESCADEKAFLCQMEVQEACFPPLAPPGYVKKSNGLYYKKNNSDVAWSVARDACVADGGELAIIYDSSTASILDEFRGDFNLWVNAVVKNKKWLTTNGVPVPFVNWSSGNLGWLTDGNCARVTRGVWHSRPCDEKNAFVCQLRAEEGSANYWGQEFVVTLQCNHTIDLFVLHGERISPFSPGNIVTVLWRDTNKFRNETLHSDPVLLTSRWNMTHPCPDKLSAFPLLLRLQSSTPFLTLAHFHSETSVGDWTYLAPTEIQGNSYNLHLFQDGTSQLQHFALPINDVVLQKTQELDWKSFEQIRLNDSEIIDLDDPFKVEVASAKSSITIKTLEGSINILPNERWHRDHVIELAWNRETSVTQGSMLIYVQCLDPDCDVEAWSLKTDQHVEILKRTDKSRSIKFVNFYSWYQHDWLRVYCSSPCHVISRIVDLGWLWHPPIQSFANEYHIILESEKLYVVSIVIDNKHKDGIFINEKNLQENWRTLNGTNYVNFKYEVPNDTSFLHIRHYSDTTLAVFGVNIFQVSGCLDLLTPSRIISCPESPVLARFHGAGRAPKRIKGKPNPVGNLKVNTSSSLVTWTKANFFTSSFELSVIPDITSPIVIAGDKNAFKLTGLTSGRHYRLSIIAISLDMKSEQKSLDFQLEPNPPTNVILSVEFENIYTLLIQWKKPEGDFSSYNLTVEPPDIESPITIGHDQTSHRLTGLKPDKDYTISLVTLSRIKKSVEVRNTVRLPLISPKTLVLTEHSTTITVHWDKPMGNFTFYNLTIEPSHPKFKIMIGKDKTEANITDLIPGREFKIFMKTTWNKELSIDISQKIRLAPFPPKNLNLSRDETSIMVSWTQPIGDFSSYYFSFSPPDKKSFFISSELTTWKINGLEPGKKYTVTMFTYSEKKRSSGITNQIRVNPAPAAGFKFLSNETSIQISWQWPIGDFDHFLLSIDPEEVSPIVLQRQDSTTINGLTPGREYKVSLVTESGGLISSALRESHRLAPLPPVNVVVTASFTSVFIHWKKPEGDFSAYKIILDPESFILIVKSLTQKQINHLTPGKKFHLSLITISGMRESKRENHLVELLQPNITFFDASEITINIIADCNWFLGDRMDVIGSGFYPFSTEPLQIYKSSWKEAKTLFKDNGTWPQYKALQLSVCPGSSKTSFKIGAAFEADCFTNPSCNGPLPAGRPFQFKMRGYIGNGNFLDTPWSLPVWTRPFPPTLQVAHVNESFIEIETKFSANTYFSRITVTIRDESSFVMLKRVVTTSSIISFGGLSKETEYFVEAVTFVKSDNIGSAESVPSTLTVKTEGVSGKTTDDDDSMTLVAGGAAAGIVVVIVIVIVFVFWSKYRVSNQKRGSLAARPLPAPPLPQRPPPARPQQPQREISIRVQLHSFVDFVEAAKQKSVKEKWAKTSLDEQFEMLRSIGVEETTTAGDTGVNKLKNRFTYIVPFDSTRVKLSPFNEEPGCDYINANYIKGFNHSQEFIATQIPILNTFADFWRMIWETNTGIIVNLAGVQKNEKVQYWPTDRNLAVLHGNIQVTTVKQVKNPDWILTKLRLKIENGEKRRVTQFLFTSWTDEAVLKDRAGFVQFVRTVRSAADVTETRLDGGGIEAASPAPIVVCCSAGVGRTGVFIALDWALNHIRANDAVDLIDIVHQLRRCRLQMVDTAELFVFLHDCVATALKDDGVYAETESGDAFNYERRDHRRSIDLTPMQPPVGEEVYEEVEAVEVV